MNRRSLLLGVAGILVAAPAIVRASSIMPVRGIPYWLMRPGLRDVWAPPPRLYPAEWPR